MDSYVQGKALSADELQAYIDEGLAALREATDPNKPYGDVSYADPGYQSDGKKRYPLDTEAHVRAAWSYINQKANGAKYSGDQVSKIKARIIAAGKKIGIKFSESDAGEWPGDVIHRTARSVAHEDKLSESDADTLIGELVRHSAESREAAKSRSTSTTEAELVEEMTGDIVALTERAINDSGIANVKLIAPGWGSSGYYSPEVLRRDGPKAFDVGTFMFWDHPTLQEDRERPEGSLTKLASVITKTPEYQDQGPDGPGLYAPVKVTAPYKEAVEELAPHIGVSIRAAGKVAEGERDGKRGRIITEISKGKSVDWVTLPGAGGKAVQLFEAYGRGGDMADDKNTKPTGTTDKPAGEGKPTETTESKRTDRERRLEERLAIRDARDIVDELLKSKANVPTATASRLRESLPKQATVDDNGDLEEKAFRELADKAIDAEVAYITEAAGLGRVRGMGPSGKPDEKETQALKETHEHIDSNLVALGGPAPRKE